MKVSENIQKVIAWIIGIACIAAMIYEVWFGFDKQVFTNPWFWIFIGPLVIINLMASKDRGSKSYPIIFLMWVVFTITAIYALIMIILVYK